MVNERNIYDLHRELIKEMKRKKITDYNSVIDLNSTQIQDREELLTSILQNIGSLDDYTSLVLPRGFFPDMDARKFFKEATRISLRRPKNNMEAIGLCVYENPMNILLEEEIEKIRNKHFDKLGERYYSGVNVGRVAYRGKSRTYLLIDVVRAFKIVEKKDLISLKRYDTLEKIIEENKRYIPFEERSGIMEEVHKISKRKPINKKSAKRKVEKKKAVRIYNVPSLSEHRYYEIHFLKLPLFHLYSIEHLQSLYGLLREKDIPPTKELLDMLYGYINLFNFEIAYPCTCENKKYNINYIKENELLLCVHEISALLYSYYNKDKEHIPKILVNPFLELSDEAKDYAWKLYKQVFYKDNPLPLPYIDDLLIKASIKNVINLI